MSQKLEAWMGAQKVWAEALSKHQGPITPTTVFGGGSAGPAAGGSNAVQNFMDIMTVNAAKQLTLGLSVRK